MSSYLCVAIITLASCGGQPTAFLMLIVTSVSYTCKVIILILLSRVQLYLWERVRTTEVGAKRGE